jgi:hypothetical protein
MPRIALLAAAALAALAAAPVAAQQSATFTGPCEVHRGDQMRCALRIPMVGNFHLVSQLVTRGDGKVTGQAQVWLSECGLPGSAGPVSTIQNTSMTHRLRQTNVTAVAVTCPEIFVFNCQEGGRSVPCQRGFGNATIRVEQQSR